MKAEPVRPPLVRAAADNGQHAVIRTESSVLWIGRQPERAPSKVTIGEDDAVLRFDRPALPRLAAAVEYSRAHGAFCLVSFLTSPRELLVDGRPVPDLAVVPLDDGARATLRLRYPAARESYDLAIELDLGPVGAPAGADPRESTDERTVVGPVHHDREPALWLREDRAALALSYYRDVMVGDALALGRVPDRRTQYALSEIRDKVFQYRVATMVELDDAEAHAQARIGIEPKGGLLDWLVTHDVFWVASDGEHVGAAVNDARPHRDIFGPWSRKELRLAPDGAMSTRRRP